MTRVAEPSIVSLDDLVGEPVCHCFRWEGNGPAYCGVPRGEQEPHGAVEWDTPFCSGCGLRHCERCRELVRREEEGV